MNRTIIIISVILLAGIGAFFYVTNDKVRVKTDSFVTENIIGNKKVVDTVIPEKPFSPTWVYEIVDGTDIEDKQFAIPRVDTTHISQVIEWQYQHGGGKYSLTYIDNYSKDNEVEYISIPVLGHRNSAPKQKEGENSYDYYKQKTDYDKYLKAFLADSTQATQEFCRKKYQFLKECYSLLNSKVYVMGSPTHRRTDAVGSLNACFKSMNLESGLIQKYLIAFSDLEDNIGTKLKPKPSDISVIVVNPVPGSTKKILGDVPEVQAPSEVLERINKLTQNR